MITVEQHEHIRRLYHLEHQSGRHIARQLGISRHSVAKALQVDDLPTYRLSKPRAAPRLEPYKARLEELLQENRRLPRKHRYTAHKLFELLQAEGYSGSESSIQAYGVRWRKAQKAPKVFLPLEFEPGQDAQVDWGEAQVILAGVQQQHFCQLCFSVSAGRCRHTYVRHKHREKHSTGLTIPVRSVRTSKALACLIAV